MHLLRGVRCSSFLLQENCSVMLHYLGMQFFSSLKTNQDLEWDWQVSVGWEREFFKLAEH